VHGLDDDELARAPRVIGRYLGDFDIGMSRRSRRKSVLVVVLVGGSSENELGLMKSYIQESGVSRNDITAKPLSKKNTGGRNCALDWQCI